MENYNGVNDHIRFGKRGEPTANRQEQELGMLSTRARSPDPPPERS